VHSSETVEASADGSSVSRTKQYSYSYSSQHQQQQQQQHQQHQQQKQQQLAEAAEALSGDVGILLYGGGLRMDRFAVQVLCPDGVRSHISLEQISLTPELARASTVELQLGVGEGGAKMTIDGDVTARFGGRAWLRQAAFQGFAAIQDLDAHEMALHCPLMSFDMLSEDRSAWVPGTRVQFRNVSKKVYEGREGSLVQWNPETSKWLLRLDGQADCVSAAAEKLQLCAHPWRCNLTLDRVDTNTTERFLADIDKHLLVLGEVLREVNLRTTTLRQRPLGLQIKDGGLLAVAGPASAMGLLPGCHIVAVDGAREGLVDLTIAELPIAMLTEPPSRQAIVTFNISRFVLNAKRMDSRSQAAAPARQAVVRFPEIAQKTWGPGPCSAFLKELSATYMQTLMAHGPQLFFQLPEDPIQGAAALVQAAVLGTSSALQHHEVAARRRRSPISDFDDTYSFDTAEVLRLAPPRSGLHADLGFGVQAAATGLQAAAGLCGAIAEKVHASGSRTHGMQAPRSAPYPSDNAASMGLQAAASGLQAFAAIGRGVAESTRAARRADGPAEPCKQQ